MTQDQRSVTPQPRAALREIWPLLVVQDIDRSIAFYRDKLGFGVVAEAQAAGRTYWCRVARQGCSLMLQQAEEEDGPPAGRGPGITLYLLCDNVDAMHAELTARGLALQPPENAYYGMRQLFVPDPDGYALCFECEV
jgi:catechol 2,3-dioxygenase-like lactoylglutathione lyase family enzyme